MTLPVLALLASRRPSDELMPLLTALTAHCLPVVPDAGQPPPRAAVLTDSRLPPPDVPFAVWTPGPDELAGATESAAVVLTRDEQVLAEVGSRGLWVPLTRRSPAARPVSPFVRGRLRLARGLAPQAVVDEAGGALRWPGRAEPLTGDVLETALGCASAAVLLGPDVVLAALAWGTPVVTDPATAGQLGLRDGVHVLVHEMPGARRTLAGELARDDARAAALGWAGRRFVEQRHDVDTAAATLAGRLGLVPRDPVAALPQTLLAELGTPPGARIRTRLADAVAPLTSSGSSS